MSLTLDRSYETLSLTNSSTANLSAAGVFTGAGDNVNGQESVSLTLFATQNCSLSVEQSSNGTNWDIIDVYATTANAGFSITLLCVSEFLRVRVTNLGLVATTAFRLSTQYSQGLYTGPRSSGAKPVAESFSVTVASDQPPISVNQVGTPIPSASGFTFGSTLRTASTDAPVIKSAFTEQTTDARRSIKSSSASDTNTAGVGARTVSITYYTAAGLGPFTETLALNGLLSVNTVNTDICYIDKLTVETVGTTQAAVGNITLQSAIAGAGVVIKQIAIGDLQSYDCVTYVPQGKTMYISGISAGHNGTTVGSGGLFRLRVKKLDTASSPLIQNSDYVRLYGQTSTFSRVYASPITVIGPAKLELWVAPETSTSTRYYGAFDYYII